MNRRHFLALIGGTVAVTTQDVAWADELGPRYGTLIRLQLAVRAAMADLKDNRSEENTTKVQVAFNDMLLFSMQAFPKYENTDEVKRKLGGVWAGHYDAADILDETVLRKCEDVLINIALVRRAFTVWRLPIFTNDNPAISVNAFEIFADRYRDIILDPDVSHYTDLARAEIGAARAKA